MEIPNWLKGLTPKKIASDSSDAPAGAPGQPAETGAIPAPDVTRVMGEAETVADNLQIKQEVLEAPVADNLNASTDKLPDWLTSAASAVSAPLPDAGSQVVDNSFVAPPDAPAIDEHFFGQTSEEIQAEKARKRAEFAAQAAPMPELPTAGVPTVAKMAETSVETETTGETPELRFERRKQGFAGAMAELDGVRNDTSGTEGEQKARLAEAYNQAIGAAMEFMEEGDVARGVAKGFFAGALGTPVGRKLTEIVIGDRMDQAGVTGAPAGEKRKKLEEAGLFGLFELLLELGMSFTDKTIGAVVTEVQSATGAGR